MSTSHLSNHEQQFHDFLAANGHPLDSGINHDSSKFHYFKCPHGSSTDARYKFYSDGIPSGYFKCWHCGIEDDFCSKQRHEVSTQEWLSHKERLESERQKNEAETQMRHAQVAELAKAVFSVANEEKASKHGYLQLKKVKNFGLRVITLEDENTQKAGCYKDTLLVPCYNSDGDLVNLERIYFDQKESKFQKRPLIGGQRNGAYYLIGEISQDTDTILIGEGAATAFTAYEATNLPIAITFNCNNLVNVAKILRKKYPEAKLIIIADDDKWHENPHIRDAGLKAAQKVCACIKGSTYILPDFSVLKLTDEELKKLRPTDINDLYTHLLSTGLDKTEVLNIINQQIVVSHSITRPTPHSEILNQLTKKITKINFRELAGIKEGEKLKQYHLLIIVVEQILELARKNSWGICKNHDFIYLYNGEYWTLLEIEELKTFLGDAAEAMGVDKFSARFFNFREQLYKQFIALANLPKPNHSKNIVRINLKNGTFQITPDEIKLCPFSHSDFITYQLPFEYNPKAEAPLFKDYLDRVLPDQQLQDILSEYLGYVFISPDILKLEKTLILYGTGANGKSVFYEIVRSLFGEQNTSEYSLQSLTNDSGYFRAMIANKLINYASEINGKLDAAIFKQLVSGEPVEARLPYGRPFTLNHYAKLIFNCNELPKDVEQTEAYFRRFLIVPFLVTIPETEQDKQLAQKIITNELSGVFNWVLNGLKRLLEQKHFTGSDTVRLAREQYEKESDSVKLFLEEEGFKAHPTLCEPIKRLYSKYRMFCQEGGFTPVNQLNFQKRLGMSKILVQRKNIGNVAFITNKTEYKNCDSV
ncbi:TPA: hypothetical protein NR240_000472 [Legionella pneumophila]|nr:hypothetical protein [Legionella pneumophila]HCX7828746.1 hypothetical protein [Legionella pneumophila]HEL8000390.1 hypothetical protein [Legionella pneumophila]